MRKFLSIVIPRYKEAEKEIFPLLSSMSVQVGVDFNDIEVIVANDGGSKPLDENFLKLFGMEIKQVNLPENRGPGVARQAGIDVACGQYIMFCDADDVLHNVGVLGALMQEAEQNVPDMLGSSWLEEGVDENGKKIYITHENENTWMHGKLLRAKFLQKHNLRFHDTLRVHEDSYLLSIAAALSEKSGYLPTVTYVWKYSPGSITRRNGAEYTYSSIPEFIRACSMAHAEIEKRAPQQIGYKILQFTFYNYFQFHHPGWQEPKNKVFLEDAEKAFVKYTTPMWHYFENAPKEKIANIYNEERARSFTGCVESETVFEWAKRIGMGEPDGKMVQL